MSEALGGDFGAGARPASKSELERTRLALWQKGVLFGVAYFACAEGSMLLNAKESPNASFWLPSGLYVAVLLINDYKTWPWLVLAAALANIPFDLMQGTPGILILIFILANTVEAVIGAWLVRTFVAKRPLITTLKEYVGLLFFAGIMGTLLGALISATGQVLAEMSPSFVKSLSSWWGSTAMATLILSPFVLAWSSGAQGWWATIRPPKRLLEATVLVVGLIATTWWILVMGVGIKTPNKSPFLVFLLWAGLRFGIRGATAANLLFSLLAAFMIQHYRQGLTPADLASGVWVLGAQVSLVVGTTLGLIPAIVLAERDKSLKVLRESEEKFSKAFRASPNGIAITELATGRYLDVNESFCQIYGYSQEEMLGRTSLELGIFSSAEHREQVIGPLRTTGHVKDMELRRHTGRGEDKTLLFSAEKIEIDGKECIVVVLFDITRRLEIEARLEQTSQQLRALTSRLQSLREEERTHLAREIHDHLGQLLTALGLDLRLIERRAGNVTDAGLRSSLQSKIASARLLTDETITSVQKLATELRPAILDRLGLEAAIEVEAQAFQSRTGVNCRWSLPSTKVELAPDQATGIFRIFQEILTNVARHAQAKSLAVCLTQQEHLLLLKVDDDGIGIQPGDISKPTSLGLLGMRERVTILGGKITFGQKDPHGTTVAVQIPLNGKATQPA